MHRRIANIIVASLLHVCFTCACVVYAEEPTLRTWTDVTGKHSVDATFVKNEKGRVHLRRADGRTVVLQLRRLSDPDRAFVAQSNQPLIKRTSFKPPTSNTNDWMSWRGPNANGVAAAGQDVPTEWSETKNIAWKVDVPGRGHSSPTVVGERIFLTTADESTQTQAVVCFDRATGKQLWLTPVNKGGLPDRIHSKNTHATPTVACNGKFLFATFNHHDSVQLVAMTLAGREVWTKQTGGYLPQQYKFGYAPSPLLYDSLVIVASEYDGKSFIVAYDQAKGAEIWRTPRPSFVSFSSPIVANIAGREQLLISGCKAVTSYDPKTGKQLWTTKATTQATCGTMIWDANVVFASGGYPDKGTYAIKADGSGEIVWQNQEKCYEQSMLVSNGYVYAVNDGGIAICWRVSDGKEMWTERLRGGAVSSSPTLVGDTIYCWNEAGTAYVFKADPTKFQSVATNQLGDETFASPAICGNQIFMRVASRSDGTRKESLYCIANSSSSK